VLASSISGADPLEQRESRGSSENNELRELSLTVIAAIGLADHVPVNPNAIRGRAGPGCEMQPLICLSNITVGPIDAAARVSCPPELFVHFQSSVRAGPARTRHSTARNGARSDGQAGAA
jgi:hypothetical protein